MTIKFKAIRTYLKSFCHWSLSTSLCQPKYSAFWTDVCQNFDFTRYIKSNNLAFQQVSSAGAEASAETVISRQMSPVFTDFPASTETTAEVYDHVFDLFMF